VINLNVRSRRDKVEHRLQRLSFICGDERSVTTKGAALAYLVEFKDVEHA
jgi:hypothetical protein